jgi:subtilisin family serine protease
MRVDRRACASASASPRRTRRSTLALALAFCLGGEALAADGPAATTRYTVLLKEPPLAAYQGGAQFATPPRIAGGAHRGRLDVHSAAATAYVDHLADVQNAFVADASRTLGRALPTIFRFRHALNGVVVMLTPAEAARLATRNDVARVEPERIEHVSAEADPAFIGADAIWNGSATNGVATQGEGVVVGELDTGINWQSPSFAATGPVDGYVHVNPLGSGNYLGTCGSAAPNPDLGHCNDKLIGMYNFIAPGGSATDGGGHGSHTASTAAGNHRQAVFGDGTFAIAGVAPHANIVAYATCNPDGSCSGSAAAAATDQAVADGVVDVLNYSVSGGLDPWNDTTSLAFLNATAAGLFVATAGGNDGPAAGSINHVEPWTMTAAASTFDQTVGFDFSLGGSGAPANAQHLAARPGSPPIQSSDLVDAPLIPSPDFNDNFGDGCSAYPAGTFARSGIGAIAVLRLSVSQSSCSSSQRYANATAAGAAGVLFVDSTLYLNLAASGNSWSMLLPDWQNVAAAIATDPATATASILQPANPYAFTGDIIAAFSSRGPSPNLGGQYLLKPDIAATGVDVLAAFSGDADAMALDDGTSMASPHIAGAAALMRALHADWTPMEIKSALSMAAKNSGITTQEGNAATPWDRGAGRVDLAAAAASGLVMDETVANFNAADPDSGGNLLALNLPSAAIGDCGSAHCSFTRTVRNPLTRSVSWSASVTGLPGTGIAPATFTLAAGATQTITLTPTAITLPATWTFGEVQLVPDDSTVSPAHWPIALQRNNSVPLIRVSTTSLVAAQTAGSTTTQAITLSNAGVGSVHWSIDTASAGCAQPAWVSYSPVSGTLLGGGISHDLVATFDATALAPGAYSGTLCIASDDAQNPSVPIALTLIVGAVPDEIFANGFDGP